MLPAACAAFTCASHEGQPLEEEDGKDTWHEVENDAAAEGEQDSEEEARFVG